MKIPYPFLRHFMPAVPTVCGPGRSGTWAWVLQNITAIFPGPSMICDSEISNWKAMLNTGFLLGTLVRNQIQKRIYLRTLVIYGVGSPLTNTPAAAVGSDFQLNSFYKEFAYGAGTGLRMDFNYFLIRFDWSYKIQDPQALEGSDSWFYKLSLGQADNSNWGSTIRFKLLFRARPDLIASSSRYFLILVRQSELR